MRVFMLALFGCVLMAGCASSPHPPKKPSPCHYPQSAPLEARRF
jgi:hypothetical protein